MSIDAYFADLQQIIAQVAVVTNSDIHLSNRGEDVGFIRGNLTFIDGSALHFREYVDAEVSIERLMYSYHFMDANHQLIFRYDDADHYRDLLLPTHPHHKHDGSEEHIVPSPAPTLSDVLKEIEGFIGWN